MVVRKSYTAEEKVKIVLDLLKGEQTQAELSSKYGVHATQLGNWKRQALEVLPEAFTDKRRESAQTQNDLVNELYQQIGQLKVELDWLKKKSALFSCGKA